MRLVNEFTVPASAETAFEILSDLERVAECLPGAVLDSRDGDEYRGRLAVKIGPVGLAFSATAEVVERDIAARRMVLRGAARDRGGQGAAQALITISISGESDGRSDATSTVLVETEVDLSGRMAQFGGAAITHVNRRVIGQFVDRLDAMVRAAHLGAGPHAAHAGGHEPRPVAPSLVPPAPSRAMLGTGRPDLRRLLGPVAATVAAGVLFGASLSRALRSAAAR